MREKQASIHELVEELVLDSVAAQKINNWQEVVEIQRQIVNLQPNNANARFILAKGLAITGNRQEALRMLDELNLRSNLQPRVVRNVQILIARLRPSTASAPVQLTPSAAAAKPVDTQTVGSFLESVANASEGWEKGEVNISLRKIPWQTRRQLVETFGILTDRVSMAINIVAKPGTWDILSIVRQHINRGLVDPNTVRCLRQAFAAHVLRIGLGATREEEPPPQHINRHNIDCSRFDRMLASLARVVPTWEQNEQDGPFKIPDEVRQKRDLEAFMRKSVHILERAIPQPQKPMRKDRRKEKKRPPATPADLFWKAFRTLQTEIESGSIHIQALQRLMEQTAELFTHRRD